jgi:hypothetical protein
MGEVTQAGRRDEPVAANERAGRREERRELLAPILGWFTEGYDTADLTEARSILEALKLTAGRGHLWVHAVDFLITFEGPLSALSRSRDRDQVLPVLPPFRPLTHPPQAELPAAFPRRELRRPRRTVAAAMLKCGVFG